MKIVYLMNWELGVGSGVSHKVQSQVEEWSKHGHQVELWIVSANDNGLRLGNCRVFEYPKLEFLPSSLLRKFLGKSLAYWNVRQAMSKNKPDIIYFRQSSWFPNLASTLSLAPAVMEINTDDLAEVAHRSDLFQKVYRWGRERILRSVAAFSATTHELGEKFAYLKKPIGVVANGIRECDPPPAKAKHDRPQLVFVGSPALYWHGTDKLVTLAGLCPEFDFHVVGPELSEIPDNMTVHGYLSQKELENLYRSMDIGIGTLAVHRNNLVEACPLKVREYIAQGLPVILGYRDTDLNESEDLVLEIQNTETNVSDDHQRIVSFVQHNWLKQVSAETRNKVFVATKEKKRLELFELVLRNSTFSR